MPSWLLPLLNALGPVVVKWALSFLEKKYPGVAPLLKEILKYIAAEPDKEVAVRQVKDSLYTTAHLPEIKKP